MNEDEIRQVAHFCRELLSGKPASDVPQEILPKVQAVMEAAMLNAVTEGNAQRVRQIQSIIADIDGVKGLTETKNEIEGKGLPEIPSPESMNSAEPKSLPESRNSPEQRDSAPPESVELNDTLEKLVNGAACDQVEPEKLPELITFTKQKIDSLIERRRLIRAQKYEDVLCILQGLQRFRAGGQENRKQELEMQLERKKQSLEEERIKMEKELDELAKKTAESRENQNKEWEEKMEKYDQKTAGELPPQYRKFSQRLLALREQENSLIKMRRYGDAGYRQMEADSLERYELVELRKRYERDREVKKATMKEQHELKMRVLEQNAERQRQKIELEHRNNIDTLKQVIANLEKRIESMDEHIKDARSAASRAPTRPASPSQSYARSSTFLSHPVWPPVKAKTKRFITPNKIVYRPIPSKWRMTASTILLKKEK